ncbi:MAG: competence/damage-inducible protein A [Anaerolineaceae bacterium]|nr:competence/damage-inducible protein A [Anaerolineaceae bacterium]
MPTAEIITIGTELLLGEIQDTNTHTIANVFRNAGIDLFRSTTIGDNEERIEIVVKEALQRSQIILTTGGLGPTVDDPTRSAIAKALGVKTEFQPELWAQIQKRFLDFGRSPTENNRRQAFIPHGALPIENPVGTAPAFIAESGNSVLIALPGVPAEMDYLLRNAVMPFLRTRFQLEGIIKAFIIHTAGVGESQIDEQIADLETLKNPTVGLVAHPGQTDIRVTAKAASEEIADLMIQQVVDIIKTRLGDIIFGTNETSLAQVVAQSIQEQNKKIAIIDAGLQGSIKKILSTYSTELIHAQVEELNISDQELEKLTKKLYKESSPHLAIGISFLIQPAKSKLHLVFINQNGVFKSTYSFGGHEKIAHPWAINYVLNSIRKFINEKH